MAVNTNQTPSSGKQVLRKLVKGPNGLPMVVFIDTMTGEVVYDPIGQGYEIIYPDNTGGLTLDQQQALAEEKKDDPYEEERKRIVDEIREDLLNGESYQSPTDNGGNVDALGLANKNVNTRDRTESNNFGYRDTPNFFSVTNKLPGKIGMASKVASAGFRANNAQAVDSAREVLGLQERTLRSTIGTILGVKDEGQIANVRMGPADSIGPARAPDEQPDNEYSVGFEALDNKGRTNLTPQEARKRSMMRNKEMEELTNEASKVRDEETSRAFEEAGIRSERKGFIEALNDRLARNKAEREITQDTYPERPGLNEAQGRNMNAGPSAAHISDVPVESLPTPQSRPDRQGSNNNAGSPNDPRGGGNGFSSAINSAAGSGLF